MDFEFTSEQEALRDSVAGMLTDAYPSTEDRRAVVAEEPGFREETWQRLASMGALGLPFTEDDGGMGAGPIEVGLVAEQVGRVLAPEPFIESVVLAGSLVAQTGSDAQRADLLGRLSDGAIVMAAALYEPSGRWDLDAREVTATATATGWALSGVKEPVLFGARADVLVVSAQLPDGGTGLFYVDAGAEGLTRSGYATHDGGRAAHVSFSATPAAPLTDAIDRKHEIEQAVAHAQIAYCHEAVGAMDTALSSTSEYLKTRKQFGVTLNSFQSLTFRAADMFVSVELAKSAVLWASMVAEAGGDVVTAARRAKLQTSRASRHVGQEAIQLHGGIGMTAEYSVGHYANRLTAIDHTLGDGDEHLAHLAASVGTYDVLDPIEA